MTQLTPSPEQSLYTRIAGILGEGRSRVARTWRWSTLMRRVAKQLSAEFGRGFSLAGLKRMKQFFLVFPEGSALPRSLLEKARQC